MHPPDDPDSPSKSKGHPAALWALPWAEGKGDRRWSGPARAAGLVLLAALAAHGVPLVSALPL